MTPADVAALTLAILAGLSAFVAALAALVQAYRVAREIGHARRDVNGRLDQLLAELEDRVRAEERLRALTGPLEHLPGEGYPVRPDPIIREIPPDQPKGA